MVTSAPTAPPPVCYPDSDGLPTAENTLRFRWISTIVGGLETLFRNEPNVFVAGDLFWYPIEGDNKTRTAPDAMVVFGRPKGDRGSYLQWLEEDIPPQVVFEVQSPGNRFGEMRRKLAFYDRFGVEEYYLFTPEPVWLEGWLREGTVLREIAETNGWVSPRLGVRFELNENEFRIVGPDGRPFESYIEIVQRLEDQRKRGDDEQKRADDEQKRADRLAEKLRTLGVDPDA